MANNKKINWNEYVTQFQHIWNQYKIEINPEYPVQGIDEIFRYRMFDDKVQIGVK
jgi:hypothetical protein